MVRTALAGGEHREPPARGGEGGENASRGAERTSQGVWSNLIQLNWFPGDPEASELSAFILFSKFLFSAF